MGRKAIPLRNGKKECRGKSGCGEWKELKYFQKINYGNYYVPHCRDCERKRQTKIREEKKNGRLQLKNISS
jgi:hypothetical protein